MKTQSVYCRGLKVEEPRRPALKRFHKQGDARSGAEGPRSAEAGLGGGPSRGHERSSGPGQPRRLKAEPGAAPLQHVPRLQPPPALCGDGLEGSPAPPGRAHLPFQLHRSLEYCAAPPRHSCSSSPSTSGSRPGAGARSMVLPLGSAPLGSAAGAGAPLRGAAGPRGVRTRAPPLPRAHPGSAPL